MSSFLLSIASLLSLGTAWFLAGRSTKKMKPLYSLFVFQLIGIPILLLLLFWFPLTYNFFDLIKVFLVGIFETFVMLIMFHAFKIGKLSVVNPVIDSYAIVTVILGIFLLHETMTLAKIAAILLITLGVLSLSLAMTKSEVGELLRLQSGVKQALLAALGTGIFFLLVTIVARRTNWLTTTLIIRIAIVITSGLILFISHINWGKLWRSVIWRWLIPAATLDAIGFSFYNMAVIKAETSYVTVITSAQSLVIVLLSFFFLKERLTMKQWLGIIGIFSGLVLLNLR